ncbi:hypothetical protein MTO96_014169 [Rhipicephalus appendiculatus]
METNTLIWKLHNLVAQIKASMTKNQLREQQVLEIPVSGVFEIIGGGENWKATSHDTSTGTEYSTKTADTVPECAPVEPRICTDLGNDSGPVRNHVFAWNVAQQRCTRVSSDAYCVREPAAGFFRDVSECSLACGDSSARLKRPAEPRATAFAEKYAPCTDMNREAADVRRCVAEDLLYPAYFDGTACMEAHERGQCRYHGPSGSFRSVEQCKEACLGQVKKDGKDSPCKTKQPTFECRDELKKVTARYDSDVRRCRPVRICLGGGYDTIEECNRHCVGKAFKMR